jgi:ERCC4-type nuclease
MMKKEYKRNVMLIKKEDERTNAQTTMPTTARALATVLVDFSLHSFLEEPPSLSRPLPSWLPPH